MGNNGIQHRWNPTNRLKTLLLLLFKDFLINFLLKSELVFVSAFICVVLGVFLLHREERKTIIRNKYEKRRYCIITSPDPEARRDDLRQAIIAKDPYALLQVFAEGIDFMEPLPQTVRHC